MLINNIDISRFNAQVLEIDIQNSSISNTKSSIKEDDINPFFNTSNIDTNTISVTLLLNSKSKIQYYKDKSNLLNNLINPAILNFTDRGLKFKAILMNQADAASTKQIRGRLKLLFKGINVGDEITEELNSIKTKTINVSGNSKIPVIVEVTPKVDIISIELKGMSRLPIVAKNLKANKKLVIDGETGLVTVDNENYFLNMDMWEFPSLIPGSNTIETDNSNCNVTIKYKPRYI